YEGRRLETARLGYLKGPASLQPTDIGRSDFGQFGVVSALIVSKVGEPIVRFARGMPDAIVSQSAFERCGCDLGPISDLQCLQVSSGVLQRKIAYHNRQA